MIREQLPGPASGSPVKPDGRDGCCHNLRWEALHGPPWGCTLCPLPPSPHFNEHRGFMLGLRLLCTHWTDEEKWSGSWSVRTPSRAPAGCGFGVTHIGGHVWVLLPSGMLKLKTKKRWSQSSLNSHLLWAGRRLCLFGPSLQKCASDFWDLNIYIYPLVWQTKALGQVDLVARGSAGWRYGGAWYGEMWEVPWWLENADIPTVVLL